jgi:hypothetical protein
MPDLLMLALTLVAFIAAGAFARACPRLMGRGDEAERAER